MSEADEAMTEREDQERRDMSDDETKDAAEPTPASAGSLKWIPAKERLPERGENVLWLVDVYGGFHHAIGCMGLNEKIFSDEGIQYWITEKTFWMPLPAPPTDAK